MKPELRFCEFRQTSDRTLEGVALVYGQVARLPWGRERFAAGAFGDVNKLDVVLNAHHRRDRPIARTGGGGLSLIDSETELRVKAELPETRDGNDVLALVKNKILRGLSIEFLPVTEGLVDGVREVTKARLFAVSVVDKPAYPSSQVSARFRQPAQANKRPWLYV